MGAAPWLSQTLVEREHEIATLRDAIGAAAGGRGSVLVLAGEAGIGKTRLLDAAADLAAEVGADVRRATGHELETDFPFGCAVELFARWLRAADADETAALLRGAAGPAEGLLLGAGGPPTPTDPLRLAHALFCLVANAAERRPLVLLVDDAHLVDGPSLRFLVYLARRVGGLAVCVVLAARPPGPSPAAELLPAVRSSPDARTLHPAPLSRAGVGWLAAELGFAGAEPEFVDACAQVSGGNPFLLRELLLVLAEKAVAGTAAGARRVHEIGPTAVAEGVFLALRRAGPGGTALARALAILDRAPISRAAALAQIGLETAIPLAAALAREGVLAADDPLSFVHPIVRTAIYEDLAPIERAHGHAQAARLLHADGVPPEETVRHLLKSDPLGAPWAAEALREVARRALAHGTAPEALPFLRRALLEQRTPDALLELARAEAAAGDAAAVGRFEQALELIDEAAAQARALRGLGRTLLAQGRYAEAATAFERGRRICPADDPALAGELRSGWLTAALYDPTRGAAALAEVAGEIRTISVPATLGDRLALSNLARAETIRGADRARAVDLARRAWSDGALLAETGPEGPANYAVAGALSAADELELAAEVWEAVDAAARAGGLPLATANAAYGRGHVALLRGALDDARAHSAFALEAQEHGWRMYAAMSYWTLARCLLERGEVEQAATLLDLPEQRERELVGGSGYLALLTARAAVLVARGEAAAALPALAAARELNDAIGWQVQPFTWRLPAARAHLALGDRGAARTVAEEAVELARRWGAPSLLAAALRALALTDAARRLDLLAEAHELVAGHPARLEAAHVAAELGRALSEAGDRDAGLALLREALDGADRIGAVTLAQGARAALVAAGARPRRARLHGAAALTPAELQVARLAAEGHTNREIAERQFVTVRAVKWHLGNVYRKLSISTRAELPDALADPGQTK